MSYYRILSGRRNCSFVSQPVGLGYAISRFQALLSADPADVVFTNGKVYTVNPEQSWAQAVAVRGKEIVYVGDDAGGNVSLGSDWAAATYFADYQRSRPVPKVGTRWARE